MKANNKNLNCSVLYGEEGNIQLNREQQGISKIYDDIRSCLYAERLVKSIFRLKGEKNCKKQAGF
jgi:hypothetical protein